MLKRFLPSIKPETLAQSVAVAMALTVVCRLVAFGRGVVLARSLQAEQLGTWALMANAVQVLAFFVALGIPSGISRYAERHRQDGTLRSFLCNTLVKSLGVALIVALLGFAFWRPLGQALFGEAAGFALVAITVAAVVATVAFSVLQGMLHGLRLFRANSIVELIHNAGFLMLAMALLFCWRDDVFSAAWAHLVITVLVTLALGVWIFRAIGSSQRAVADDKPNGAGKLVWWSLVVYSLGTWSAASLQAIWRCLDRYMLLHFGRIPAEEALDQIGQYFIATKLCQPISALVGILAVILLPHAARLWEDRKHAEVADLIRLMGKITALGMTCVGALLVIFKPFLLWLLIGYVPKYASLVFAPVIVTIIVVSLQYIVRTYLLCRERTWTISVIWLAALAANVVLNLWLIPQYQLAGAATATMLSAALAIVAVLIFSSRSGLGVDRGLWLAAFAPAILLLPVINMLALLAVLVSLIVCSNGIFTDVEKLRINGWCREKLGNVFPQNGLSDVAKDNDSSAGAVL